MKQIALRLTVIAAAFSFVLLAPMASVAAPIVGSVNTGGAGDATVTLTSLTFNCNSVYVPLTGSCTSALPSTSPSFGNFVVSSASGAFAGDVGGIIGSINNTIAPVNTPVTVSNWVQFVTPGPTPTNIVLDLNMVSAGVNGTAGCLAPTPAAGQLCTPAFPALVNPNNPQGLSPYNLENISASQSIASFAVSGTARNITTGDNSPFIGTFSSNFNQPFQQLLSQIAPSANQPLGGSISNSWSATFTAVPEPRSTALLLAGLFIFGLVGTKRVRRNFSER